MDIIKSISRAFLASRFQHHHGHHHHADPFVASRCHITPQSYGTGVILEDPYRRDIPPVVTPLRHRFMPRSPPPPPTATITWSRYTASRTPLPTQSSPGFGTYPPVSAGVVSIPPSPSSSSTQSAPQASTSVGRPQ